MQIIQTVDIIAHIKRLVAQHGTYEAAGKAIGVTGARLHQLAQTPGQRLGPKILKKLGYTQEPPRFRRVAK